MSFQNIKNISSFNNYPLLENRCMYCLTDFQEGDQVMTHEGPTPHPFHLDCINHWVQRVSTCPTCNMQVTSVNGVQIIKREPADLLAKHALVDAVKEGDLPTVTELLTHHLFEEDILDLALICAAGFINPASRESYDITPVEGADYLGVVRAILGNGDNSEKARGNAVKNASRVENMELLQALLDSGNISEEYRGEALWNAAQFANPAMTVAILAHGPVSERSREIAFKKAATYGSDRVIDALVANGAEISARALRESIETATEDENLNLVNKLLAMGPLQTGRIGDALATAAKKGNQEIFTALLRVQVLTTDKRGDAIVEAAKAGHTEFVKTLLKTPAISETDKRHHEYLSKQDPNYRIIMGNMSTGPIYVYDRGLAAVEAAKNNHLGIVEILLADGPISENARKELVQLLGEDYLVKGLSNLTINNNNN